jgi:hypothetical protein
MSSVPYDYEDEAEGEEPEPDRGSVTTTILEGHVCGRDSAACVRCAPDRSDDSQWFAGQ